MRFWSIKRLLVIVLSLLSFLLSGQSFALFYGSDKPLFVEVSSDWCFACKLLKPTMEGLKKKYGNQVEFILLDASSEESAKQATELAYQYGIADFFNNNRNALPTVGILSIGGILEGRLLGARNIEAYIEILDGLLAKSTRPTYEPSRPELPQPTEIAGSRPDAPELSTRPDPPNFLSRPPEATSSGRPEELTFWAVGYPIPYYAYFQYVLLPECSGDNNVVCANLPSAAQQSGGDSPAFKPWNPNTTRNEKGYSGVVKKG